MPSNYIVGRPAVSDDEASKSIALGKDARPLWKAGCEHCMCCVNYCPEAAIEFGRFTTGKRRYTYWQRNVN